MMTEIIKRRRKELGMTQKEFAELLDISSKTVSRWESGVQLPDVVLVPDIARILGITVNELYGITDDGPACDSQKAADELSNAVIKQDKVSCSANPKTIRIYRLICVISDVIAVLGGIWLCVFDSLRISMQEGLGYIRIIGYAVFFAGLILLLMNQLWFTVYYMRNDKNNTVYRTTALRMGGGSFLIVYAMAGVMLPLLIGVPFSELYAVICITAAAAVQMIMIYFFRSLRKYGVNHLCQLPMLTGTLTMICFAGYLSCLVYGLVVRCWADGDGTLAYYSADRLQIIANIQDMTHRMNYMGMLVINGLILITLIITYAYLMKKTNDINSQL